jgi:flagellar biosynthesis GTPase FlhF
MEKQINFNDYHRRYLLTCKRAERKYELVDWNEVITVKGYEVYNGDTPVCFISKCDTLENWEATTFDDYENCEGLVWGDTKKELLANIERLLRQGTLYLTWDERKAKRKAEREQDERNYNAIVEYRKAKAEKEAKEVEEKRNAELEKVAVGIDKMATEAAKMWKEHTEAKEVAELEASEDEVKEAKSDEACKLFNELDDDGLSYTKHYDEALCQKQNVQYHWDEDLSVEDIETVIEYFKNLKQLIKLERKVNKLAIYG